MTIATNTNNEDFAVGAAGHDATHWTMWAAAAGGAPMWTSALGNNPAALAANEFYRLAPGDISLEVPVGADGAAAATARIAVEAVVAEGSGRYFQLHDGAPGVNGTNNVLTARKLVADFSYA